MLDQQGTLEISRSRLAHNLRVLRQKIGPGKKLCATIKADAYGHGVAEIAALLREEGIDWASVYSVAEAIALAARAAGQGFHILALAPFVLLDDETFDPTVFQIQSLEPIRINITDVPTAGRLSANLTAHKIPRPIKVHVQIDAGLTRVGVEPREAEELADAIAQLPGLQLEGVFAHFSHGDVPQHDTVGHQMTLLQRVALPLKQRFPHLMVHLQNSGGAWHLDPADHTGLDMVRIGIALYGLQPSTAAPIPELLPIAQVTAPILAIHDRPPGTGVGYGHTFITARHSRLAIVPVGYAEGYPRQMSNRSVAQIRGVDAPVVGRISMDQIILDITDVPGGPVQLDERVTVISHDPARANSLDAMADAIGTIGYELATRLGPRLKRVVVD